MDELMNSIVGGARKRRTVKKVRRAKKPMSAYNKFVQHYMKQGVTMSETAKMWRQYKRGTR
jgi:hypothetical protein